MTDRVSSYGQSNYMLSQLMKLEGKYSAVTTQSSSGLKSETFSGIASDSQTVLNLQSQYSRITTQTSNATNAKSTVTSISSTLSSMGDVVTSALSNLSVAISTTGSTGTSTQTEMQLSLNQLVNLMNTQYAGNYIFSGSATSTAPVNLSDSNYTNLSTTTANTSYYQGNNTVASVQASDDLTVNYGISADNTSFEKALRALSIAVANPNDTTSLKAAYDLLGQASTGIGDLESQATVQSNTLDNQITVNSGALSYIDTNISDLTSADLSQVSVQLTDMQNQLQASYAALAKLLNLNLSNYLK